MNYKDEYLREKKKYIELRDQVVQQFNQTGGSGFIDRLVDGVFGSNYDNDSEGGALPEIKPDHEIIFFNIGDLSKGTVNFDVIKGRLINKDKQSRQAVITSSKYTLSTTDLYRDLRDKAYKMKLSDSEATLVKPGTVKLKRQSLPSAKPQPREQLQRSESMPNIKIPEAVQMAARKCVDNFNKLDSARQDKCLMIFRKIKDAKQRGGSFDVEHEFSILFGGSLDEKLALKVDKTSLFSDAKRQELLSKLEKRTGLKFDTVLIIEHLPGTDKATIIGLYKDYEY